MRFFSTNFFRGLIAQIAGTVLGMGLVMALRVIFGLPLSSPIEADDAHIREVIVVGGVLVGALSFLVGVGVFSDWFKWARGEETSDEHTVDTSKPNWLRYFSVDFDHKVIGVQYGVTSMLLLLFGGTFAMLFRVELAQSGITFLNSEIFKVLLGYDGTHLYNTLMSLHGIVMIGGILLGIGALSNYLVPMLIGANDMAFPRLNAFAFWVNVPGAIILLSSLFLGGFDTGWVGYPPLSLRAPLGMQMFLMGVYLIGVSSIAGSINVIVSILTMRAKGMSMLKMPIFCWAALATALIQFTATQLIGLSFQLVMLERLLGMPFFDSLRGGDPILYQHLFWFYSHPAVYVFILPGLGIISELLPVYVRKPLYGYKWVAFSSLGIAAVSFFVWAHHMFVSGMSPFLRIPFMYSTLLVAVPTGVKFFSWAATLWQGKIEFKTPMLFTLGAVVIFLLGGVTGPPLATIATDLHLHDTWFVVGHFHDTMFGGFIFPIVAAVLYWFPKMTGRMYNEKLGVVTFWFMFIGFMMMSNLQLVLGLLGMRRRVADFDAALGFDSMQLALTIGGFMVFFGMLLFAYNIIRNWTKGEKAEGNVWDSRSPEWQRPNPMPLHNYDQPFEVVGEPYDYGMPNSTYVNMNPAGTNPTAH
ncbi:MAG TPA: cbb3-type cytochrome c oxidase subunit I [Anaerolineales bacterium]|nr:cbb3-type cytochrome c oxidase subunit I [Anaerolineales bacterium]HRQ92224.1 cbb3-type cytochrome c oxidase subunit I [Anaerolineales bacterium]